MAIYNVTNLLNNNTRNGLRAFLNTHKLQVVYSDTLNEFGVWGDTDMNKNRLELANKRVSDILGDTTILKLQSMPQVNISDCRTKRMARRAS